MVKKQRWAISHISVQKYSGSSLTGVLCVLFKSNFRFHFEPFLRQPRCCDVGAVASAKTAHKPINQHSMTCRLVIG